MTNLVLEKFKTVRLALASVAQWIEHWPGNKRVASSIPQSRAHAWIVGQDPSREHARDNHTLMLLYLSPFLPLCLKINKILLKIRLNITTEARGQQENKNSCEILQMTQ